MGIGERLLNLVTRPAGVSQGLGESLSEAGRALAVVPSQQDPGAGVQRIGFDSDVPPGGAKRLNPGGDYPDGRAAFMTSLYNAYVGCPWLSASIDVVARTITAGGLQITPDTDADDDETPDEPPPAVQALQQLLDFCNPHQDIVQLFRGAITDLGIYGDCFLEVVWLLGLPVALYSLDPATMTVDADEHGQVNGYDQTIDNRTQHFEPDQVIHISMDAPKGSLYGMGTAQKALLPVTVWLFTEATIKETMRKGDPPSLHMDFPLEVQPPEVRTWRGQYRSTNLGTENIGNPITTRGGVKATELQIKKLETYIRIKESARDTILSVGGVPPAKVGVIESGNLGGGTGASQDKTFKTNTCGPVASIFLEKINYSLTVKAFGIDGWSVGFTDVDYRDDETVEKIRNDRLRNGAWTLNDYLTDIGQPTIGPEGDVHVLITTREIITWDQVQEYSAAAVAALQAKTDATKAQAEAAKTHADAAATAAANGVPLQPGVPPNGPPAATPPTSPAGTTPDEQDPPEKAETVPASWRARVAEHYRQLVTAGSEKEI